MNFGKKVLSLLLALMTVFFTVPVYAEPAAETVESGEEVEFEKETNDIENGAGLFADSVVSRDDGVWLFPADSKYYKAFTDFCGCLGNSACPFHKIVHPYMTQAAGWSNCHGWQTYSQGHNGFDIGVPNGSSIYAAAPGYYHAVSASSGGSRGAYVYIEHPISGSGYSYYSYYQHLSAVYMNLNNTYVQAGDLIGKSGNSGGNYGYHLHFGIVLGKSGASASVLNNSECKGWLLSPGLAEGEIVANPSSSSPVGLPSSSNANDTRAIQDHCGSVRYTFNKNEVSIGANSNYKQFEPVSINSGEYRLVNNESYLTATADNNTTAVAVQAKNGASSQKFYISPNSRFSQSYVIKTQAYSSGRVLNVFTSGVSANGDSVTLYTSTTDASQSWKFEAKSGGYLIHPVDNTGLALTNNNGTAKVMTSTGASNQIWKLVSAVDQYTISYNANGGTGAPGTQHQTHDRYMTLSSVIPERTGYTFKGWSTGPDGNVSYQPGEVRFCENRDLTLFAVWEANKYIIYFDPNGGNVSESSRNITYGERYGNLPVPTRNGYAFDGWYTISGRFVSNWLIFEETSNQNLYAHWKTTSKLFDIVKVDKQLTLNIGESNTVHTWIYNSSDVTLSFSSENESIAYVTSDGKITGISNGNTNVNVTAYFDNSTKTESCYVTVTNQRVGYTVSYNANGGENAPTNQIKYYGQNLTLNGSVPSRFGYTFKGWSTSANGSVQYSPGSIYSGNADLTLYAVWQINSVTSVTLNLTSAALKKGETLKLTETVLPADAANKNVTWSSSDTSVATVLNGTVTAVGSGTAKITVKTNDGGKTAVCTVTVTETVLNAKAKFTISETSGRPGDTVKVKLSMKTDEKINAIAVSNISFDSEMLTFEGFSDYEHIAEMTVLPPSFDEEKMAIVIGLKNAAAFDSDICTLEFRINENAPEGVYSINADTIVKLSSAVVTSSVNPGKVTVRMQKLGDIDGNDTVDIDDAVLLFRHSMLPELYPISYAGNTDYNHDGNVDIDDAVMLFRYSMLPELYPID